MLHHFTRFLGCVGDIQMIDSFAAFAQVTPLLEDGLTAIRFGEGPWFSALALL